jgi:hypothetical protein
MYSRGDLEDFFDGYVAAALFSSSDESNEAGGEPLDSNYSPDDLDSKTEDRMIADCKRFLDKTWKVLDETPDRVRGTPKMERAGMDFWFTRNGHGVGFHDDWPDEVSDTLANVAHSFGEVNLYVHDGKIYQ